MKKSDNRISLGLRIILPVLAAAAVWYSIGVIHFNFNW